jgi:hypothetical protein
MAQTARISQKSDEIAEELHAITGKTKVAIIEIALEEYRFREKMRLFNEAYAKMRNDKTAWEDEMKERAELEGTLADGLEDE